MLLLRLLVSVCRSSGALVGLGALRFRRRRRRGLGLPLGVEVVLVEEELAEGVVDEPAVAVVAAVLVLEVARVLDDLADIRPVYKIVASMA